LMENLGSSQVVRIVMHCWVVRKPDGTELERCDQRKGGVIEPSIYATGWLAEGG
jgi:hypothetical protein